MCCLILNSSLTFAESQVPDFERHEGIIDFRPYASANVGYDSNIFKLENAKKAQQILGTSQMSDKLFKTEIGLESRVRLSRQLITLGMSLNDTKYDRFNNLDYTGNAESLAWNWVIGNHLEGVLRYSSNETASGFSDIVNSASTVRKNNLRTTQVTQASVKWHFHPDWDAFSTFSQTEYRNNSFDFRFTNRQEDELELGIHYNSPKTVAGMIFKSTDSTYSQRSQSSLALFGNTSTRNEATLTLGWAPTQKLNMNTAISRVMIDYPDHNDRNSSNISYTLEGTYIISEDTKLLLSSYKRVSQVDDIFSTYAQTQGVIISPSWKISSKITLGASWELNTKEYLGSSRATASGKPREDDLENYRIFVNYLPAQNILMQLIGASSERTSSIAGVNFTDQTVMASIAYEF